MPRPVMVDIASGIPLFEYASNTTSSDNATAKAAATKAAIAKIVAARNSMSESIPEYLLLALMALLLIIIFLDSPRIINRIRCSFSSIHPNKSNPPTGGEFTKGYFLTTSEPTCISIESDTDSIDEKGDEKLAAAASRGRRKSSMLTIMEEPEDGTGDIVPTVGVVLSVITETGIHDEKIQWTDSFSNSGSSEDDFEPSGRHRRFSSVASDTPMIQYHAQRRRSSIPLPTRKIESPYSPPTFAPPLLSYLPFSPILLLSTPFPKQFPHFTIGHLLLLGTYILLVMISLFYRTALNWNAVENPAGVDAIRSGFVALAQIPVVVGLGGRNSLVRYLLGGGENGTVQRVHKLVGKSVFGCILMHAGIYFHKWVKAGKFFTYSKTPYIIAGWISLSFLSLMVLTSLPFFRTRFYSLFTLCHFIGMFGFLVALAYHVDVAVPFVVSAFVLYGLDLLARIGKMRLSRAALIPLAGAETTVVEIEGLKGGWRSGQYCVIRLPGLYKTTGLHALEGHPFTIATAPNSDGLVLMAKNTGDWTKALYERALKGQKSDTEAGTSALDMRVLVEGPYGGPGNIIYASYSSVLLIAGGSGITFALAVAQDLISKATMEQSIRAKVINLIWVCRTQDIARPMVKFLRALVEDARFAEKKNGDTMPTLRVHIYLTRSPLSSPIDILAPTTATPLLAPEPVFEDAPQPDAIPSRPPSIAEGSSSDIEVTSRRPMIRDIIESAVDTASEGVGVAVCGPHGLVTDVRGAVIAVKEWRRVRCGGIELHEEFFGY